MASVNEEAFTDIIMKEPILRSNRKRLLSLPENNEAKFIGSLVLYDDTFFEVVAEDESELTLKAANFNTIKCSKLELYPSGKNPRFQKPVMSLINQTFNISVKNPLIAASFLLKMPMLFRSSKEINFVVNYTGEGSNIFEFTESVLSDNLLCWNVQLARCVFTAPEIPPDYKGDLIVLAVLRREGIVLLGSKREFSFENCIDDGFGLIFYASRSTKGRGQILFLEVADRIQDARKSRSHYLSTDDVGSFPSCFYFDMDSLLFPKAVALPLTMANDSDVITNNRIQTFFCLRLLKEMSGAVLASLTVTKKAKSVINPLTSPQVSTKVKLLMTPVERLILYFSSNSGVPSS